MSVESALYDHLTADAALTALVSNRIYPTVAPQNVTLPYVTFNVIAGEHERHALAGAGLAQVSVQIDVWDDDAAGRRSVTDALFDRLHGFRGQMGTEQLEVRSVHVDGPTDSYEEPIQGGEEGIFRGRTEIQVWHTEAVPTFT